LSFIDIIKAVCLLIGAAILGNWFLSEVRDAKKQKNPGINLMFHRQGC
jgi:hypothetical protein